MFYTAYVLICQVAESPVPWYDPPDVSLSGSQAHTIPRKRAVHLREPLYLTCHRGHERRKVPP